jgi:hypothetical protein
LGLGSFGLVVFGLVVFGLVVLAGAEAKQPNRPRCFDVAGIAGTFLLIE